MISFWPIARGSLTAKTLDRYDNDVEYVLIRVFEKHKHTIKVQASSDEGENPLLENHPLGYFNTLGFTIKNAPADLANHPTNNWKSFPRLASNEDQPQTLYYKEKSINVILRFLWILEIIKCKGFPDGQA